eukprot:NODE_3893_length_624_cov_31.970435_g2803_i0.p1 GENE.NODE_3893_length_624_cov_31.970435_g2803_i0~~NODE_3893_length_624_cov_31.970435_g2803_i0.p1  ORF type:complete len:117 (-),score=8.97 NODE_3893_length_624_cov_31.970435_g2803_i0:158-508(-)
MAICQQLATQHTQPSHLCFVCGRVFTPPNYLCYGIAELFVFWNQTSVFFFFFFSHCRVKKNSAESKAKHLAKKNLAEFSVWRVRCVVCYLALVLNSIMDFFYCLPKKCILQWYKQV